MNANNIGIVFAPSLFRRRLETQETVLLDNAEAQKIISFMILENEPIFATQVKDKRGIFMKNDKTI
jgi:hypothetical protein